MTTKTITLTITTDRGFIGVQVDNEIGSSIIGGSPKQVAALTEKRIEEMAVDLCKEDRKKWDDSQINFAE